MTADGKKQSWSKHFFHVLEFFRFLYRAIQMLLTEENVEERFKLHAVLKRRLSL